MVNTQNLSSEMPIDELISRVKIMLNDVDLDTDMPEIVASDIAVTELSGTPVVESTKKLAILKHQGHITREEYRRIVLARIL